MARVDPVDLIRYTAFKEGGPPNKVRWDKMTPAIGLMPIVIKECKVNTPGYVQTGPKDSYRVRCVSGLPFMGTWDLELSCWGQVLKFTGPIYAPIGPGISFLSQGEGKGIVPFSPAL